MAANYSAMGIADLIKAAKAILATKDGLPMINIPSNTPAALLNLCRARKEEIRSELIRRKDEDDREREANKARWEAERLAQIEADRPLLEQMHREAEALAAKIPADHVRVTVTQVGNADGVPTLEYSVGDVSLNWQDVTCVGSASAIRPGAIGEFAVERVYSIATNRLTEIKTAQEAERSALATAYEARDKELAETPIPDEALKAYNRYRGDPDAAWEAEDADAAMTIRHWAPYIERQHGMHKAEFARQLHEAAREASYGVEAE